MTTLRQELNRAVFHILAVLWLVQGLEGAANLFRVLLALSLLLAVVVVLLEGALAAHDKLFPLMPEPWPPAEFVWSLIYWGLFLALGWHGHYWTCCGYGLLRALLFIRKSIHAERRRAHAATGGAA